MLMMGIVYLFKTAIKKRNSRPRFLTGSALMFWAADPKGGAGRLQSRAAQQSTFFEHRIGKCGHLLELDAHAKQFLAAWRVPLAVL